jgi:hypothetical protein
MINMSTNTADEIIAIEWRMFDATQNRGGRAACQDDMDTFYIMRSSQLEAWNEFMRESYCDDLLEAQKQGRNLISEKYGYMMERTNPVEFEEIRDMLPPRDPEKDEIIDKICLAHTEWLDKLAKWYPHLANQGRPIHRTGDAIDVTSFETYLWGELATYSLKTIRLYAEYVEKLQDDGLNMNTMIMNNMVTKYGYSSMQAAEERLAGK